MEIMDVDNKLIENFKDLLENTAEFNKQCFKISQDVESDNITIVKLVEDLRDFLINTSPSKRAYGLTILTEVLRNLPKNYLNAAQLDFIVTFYADRLKDHHQVIPVVLEALTDISKLSNFPEGGASKILTQLFHNVSCQQQQQRDRRHIYMIFDTFLTYHPNELLSMGLDYVYGVLSAIDGERDPKNLLFLFGWIPRFLNTVSLGHLTEEFFEVLACYFPVDFKAPPQDSNDITRELLADALCPCLCAIPDFAEFCLPLALEKLESDLHIAKLDSLKLIEHGCLNFDTSSYNQHSTEIWSQLHKHLITSSDSQILEAALITLKAFVEKLSYLGPQGDFKSLLKDITDTVRGNLFPGSKLFVRTSKLLVEVIKASRSSALFVAKEILSSLTNVYNISVGAEDKMKVLQGLVDFMLAFNKWGLDLNNEIKILPILCVKASIESNQDLKVISFNGLSQMTKFLPSDLRDTIYENFRTLLIVPLEYKARLSVLKCFNQFAQDFPQEIQTNVLNKLSRTENLQLYLSALCFIVRNENFTDFVLETCLNYLNVQEGSAINEDDGSIIAIQCLKDTLLQQGLNETVLNSLIEKGTTKKLLHWLKVQASQFSEVHHSLCLKNVTFLLNSLVGCQEIESQNLLLQKEICDLNGAASLKQFPCVYVTVLNGYCLKLRRGSTYLIDYACLIDLVLVGTAFVADVGVELLANCLNKCENEQVLENNLNLIECKCDGLLEEQQNIRNVVAVLTWVTKALVQRNHEKATYFTDKLIQLLEVHPSFAEAFKIILNDSYDSLSVESYCNKMILYRQKFFTIVTNKLSQTYTPEKKVYLSAFGRLIEGAPKQVILLQLPKIFQLIILTLDNCQEEEVLCVILNALSDFIVVKETFIEEHLEDFLNRFLVLTQMEQSMKVRILAVQCVESFTSGYPLYKLLPFKNNVISVLGKCIDDKKRIVRRNAANARSLWYLLDAPV